MSLETTTAAVASSRSQSSPEKKYQRVLVELVIGGLVIPSECARKQTSALVIRRMDLFWEHTLEECVSLNNLAQSTRKSLRIADCSIGTSIYLDHDGGKGREGMSK